MSREKRKGDIKDMWVRSQNKNKIMNVSGFCRVDNDIYALYGDDDVVIASYSTEEKAIAALDKVCNALNDIYDVRKGEYDTYVISSRGKVFSMPQDNEVK